MPYNLHLLPDLDYLRTQLEYNPLTGDLIWIVKRRNIQPGNIAGHVTTLGYRVVGIDKMSYHAHRIAYYMGYGVYPSAPPRIYVIHYNNDGLDNRLANLGLASKAEYLRHRPRNRSNTSGARNVHRDKAGAYVVTLQNRHIGRFRSLEEAAAAASAARRTTYGDYAHD